MNSIFFFKLLILKSKCIAIDMTYMKLCQNGEKKVLIISKCHLVVLHKFIM